MNWTFLNLMKIIHIAPYVIWLSSVDCLLTLVIVYLIYHIDIWWPSQILTIEGFQYFLTIINCCTQFTWVYLLQAKKNVEQGFHRFYSLIHNQFLVNIKSIFDNTPKLALSKFFHDKMIISYNSYVDRPKQNSIV